MYKGIETFGDVVKAQAAQFGDRRFIRFDQADLTFHEFHDGGNKAANMLLYLGMQKGDRCAVMLQNSPAFLMSWLGIARLGAIEVPINTGLRGDLFAYILNQAQCKVLIIKDEWIDRLNQVQHQLLHLERVLVVGDATLGFDSFDDLLAQASNAEVHIDVQPTDPSLILFTSGTTGPSKGAILSHKANFALSQSCIRHYELYRAGSLVHCFPTLSCKCTILDDFGSFNYWQRCGNA